jgi:predicted N-acyltransferase
LTDSPEITLEAVSSIGQIPAGDWDACANSDGTYNPFVTHAFFAAWKRPVQRSRARDGRRDI